jgi:hypothetical protein
MLVFLGNFTNDFLDNKFMAVIKENSLLWMIEFIHNPPPFNYLRDDIIG